MKTTTLVLSLIFTLLCSACANMSAGKHSTTGKEESSTQSILTRDDAMLRSTKISGVKYDLSVRLNETATYTGVQNISFELSDASADIRVDFFKGELKNVVVNDQTVAVVKTPTYFWLPQASLKQGHNTVSISYTTEMQTNGTGIHHFVDPQDKSVFVYTQFEAFDAHKFMPCFDQPDLKATLRLQVLAPNHWTVVSTAREQSVQTKDDNKKLWQFPETAPISTYLFSLHAGPFRVWKDSFEGMPLRLLARPNLAKYVPVKLWFKLTKQGLGFYNSYFAYPYPFKKFDQLLVPEFNAGAMENVGAVTFTERMASRGKMTREDEVNLAGIILHEMAHMWFGDLVTMKWWNDLWLNESFATYMSSLAIANATEYKEAWKDFYRGNKAWAYYQDQLSTTHPIESHAKDTMEAFASFDGITYGKGASVLKQMNHWLGPKVFQQGVQAYMQSNAFKNAELKDFISYLQQFSSSDFVAWSNAWLKQAGVDTLRSSFTCDNGKLSAIHLAVTPQISGGTFRPQRIKLALYQKNSSTLKLLRAEEIILSKADQTVEWTGACPDLLYPNFDDEGYAKVILDPQSVETIKSHMSAVQDPLLRLMLWSNLWEMVRDQNMALTEYAEIVQKHIDKEKDLTVLRSVISSLSGRRANILAYWPLQPELVHQKRDTFVQFLEHYYWSKVEKAAAASDEQALWFDNYTDVASSPKVLQILGNLLDAKTPPPPGLKIDQDRRWGMINRLCRMGDTSCTARVEKEKLRDTSDRGVKSALASLASRPDLTVKESFYKQVVENKNTSLQMRSTIAGSLFPYEQRDFMQSFENRYFAYLENNKHSGELENLSMYSRSFLPSNCTATQRGKIETFMSQNKDLPMPIIVRMRETLDEDTRCQKIRTKLSQALGL